MGESLARLGPYHFGVAMVAVCAVPEVASILVGRGVHVLLCSTEASMLADAVVSLRTDAAAAPAGPHGSSTTAATAQTAAGFGRIAALVGDLAEPDVQAAARAMAQELFGAEPVLVHTESDACQLLTGESGPDRA